MRGHLSTVLPFTKKLRLPFTRDVLMVFFIALNELILGFETYLAHVLNGTIRFYEWIPILCGPFFALLLIISFLVNTKKPALGISIASVALWGSIVVGLLGTYFHVVRAIRPFAALGNRIDLRLLVWGAPVFAPPTFILIGLLGLMALSRTRNGINHGAYANVVWKNLPFSKDTLYFIFTSFGVLIATISSIFDHLRGGFHNPWLWFPTLAGVYAYVVAIALAIIKQPKLGDLTAYTGAMVLLLIVGPVGLLLHILFNLGPGGVIVWERFLKGAPVLAPMVFSNMGLLGLLVLFDPE
ncbi:MAG: hypothetical protein P1S60_17720 [Anaerolineae bacterium]|nr:hypothetical protein [Anaerolineae bacterium]